MPEGQDPNQTTGQGAPDQSASTSNTTTTNQTTGTGGYIAPTSNGVWTDGQPFDPDRARHTIRTLREEAKAGASAARERDELAAKLAEIEDAKKTDDQRLRDELDALKQATANHDAERAQWRAERAVMDAAGKAGITDVALALALVKPGDITFNDDGTSNVDDVLAALVERHPAIGQEPTRKPPATDAKQGRTPTDGPKLTATEQQAAEAMGMTPDDYARYKGLSDANDHAAMVAANRKG